MSYRASSLHNQHNYRCTCYCIPKYGSLGANNELYPVNIINKFSVNQIVTIAMYINSIIQYT